jgi:hypothetical protein
VSASAPEHSTLHVKAVFHGIAPEHAEEIAAEMIGRAHELANTPRCACDVDVSVASVAAEESDVQERGPGEPGAGAPGVADRDAR